MRCAGRPFAGSGAPSAEHEDDHVGVLALRTVDAGAAFLQEVRSPARTAAADLPALGDERPERSDVADAPETDAVPLACGAVPWTVRPS
ncbi:hypothetical protein TK78_03750 [Streptomyces sp. Tue 6075]|nr:hypothetical protein TK78_03750 [Streptomyces sp. Tue 6075]